MSYRDMPIPFPGRFTGNQILTGSWRTHKPIIDNSACTRCGICQIYCPEASIVREEEEFVIDYRFCKGCGICETECPAKSITMEREVSRGEG